MFKWFRKREKAIKFCKDCKFHKIEKKESVCKSLRSWATNVSLITGEDRGYYRDCTQMRYLDCFCGESAKYFEPKENV